MDRRISRHRYDPSSISCFADFVGRRGRQRRRRCRNDAILRPSDAIATLTADVGTVYRDQVKRVDFADSALATPAHGSGQLIVCRMRKNCFGQSHAVVQTAMKHIPTSTWQS